MFTGLVAGIGRVERFERGAGGARMRVCTELAGELTPGDSIAVSGVCLTATAVDADAFDACMRRFAHLVFSLPEAQLR